MKIYSPEVQYFPVTKDKADKFFKYNGWPSVCIDDRGVLYAVASSMRLSHGDPCGKSCMYMSYDGGKTWTKPFVINDSYVDDRDMGICYLGNGKLIVSWFTEAPANFMDNIQEAEWFDKVDQAIAWGFSEAWKTLPPEVYAEEAGSFVMMSDDYGVTWSERVRIPVAAPHGMNVCSDGTIVMLGQYLYNDSYSYIDENGEEVRPPITCVASRDGGYHWEVVGQVPNGIGDLDGGEVTPWEMFEPHICELPDGRLLGAIRCHSVHNKELFTTMITFSDDQGKTWTAPKGLGIDGMPPHIMVHSSGAIIISYSCRTEGIRCERAIVSYDNGETWTEDYMLDHRIGFQKDMGYPATAELEDGSLVTVYYQGNPGETWTSINCTKWRLVKKSN
jgi:hypothetical protein